MKAVFDYLLPGWNRCRLLRPVFRRSSTFGLFALLATGLVARTTRRTVVGMLAGTGMAAIVSFHSACRFFSHHAWDVDRLELAVARRIADRLRPPDTAITVVVDDTLFRRWGQKVHHAFWTHDGAAQGPAKLGRGNRWGKRRDRRAVAVLRPSGVPADPVPTLGRQGHRQLLRAAGFELARNLPVLAPYAILEAVPADPTPPVSDIRMA